MSADTVSPPPLLEIEDLDVVFSTPRGPLRAVRSASFTVAAGEVHGIVGESGSGKSAAVRGVLRLFEPSQVAVSATTMTFNGMSFLDHNPSQMRELRGRHLGLISQSPMTALNPTRSIGSQASEILRVRSGLPRRTARQRILELLDQVAIPNPSAVFKKYPHQLSGGMLQRVLIAVAVGLEPRVLFADEPTTALDVTIQAQILELLGSVQQNSGMGLVFISHDLGVIGEIASRVSVMYAGKIVESGPATEVLLRARHPYTRGLLAASPTADIRSSVPLEPIPGSPPDLTAPSVGCAFAPRCTFVQAECWTDSPRLVDASPGLIPANTESTTHTVACWVEPSPVRSPVRRAATP